MRCIGNVGRNALETTLVRASYPKCRLVTDIFAPTYRFGCLWYLLQCWKRTRKETDAGLFILCGENASNHRFVRVVLVSRSRAAELAVSTAFRPRAKEGSVAFFTRSADLDLSAPFRFQNLRSSDPAARIWVENRIDHVSAASL